MHIIDEVKKIERDADDLAVDYQNKLHKLEKNTQDKIAEMRRNIEKELATFQSDEMAKKKEQLAVLQKESSEHEAQEIAKLQARFAARKDDLINAVLEEVMRKYGNS